MSAWTGGSSIGVLWPEESSVVYILSISLVAVIVL